MIEQMKTKAQQENEAAAEYLQEELEERLKCLGGKPDALCQAYQAAIRALRPEFKHYVVTISSSKIRNAQAKFQKSPDSWRNVYGDVVFDEFPSQSMDEAKKIFDSRRPSYVSMEDVVIHEYILPL